MRGIPGFVGRCVEIRSWRGEGEVAARRGRTEKEKGGGRRKMGGKETEAGRGAANLQRGEMKVTRRVDLED